MSVRDKWVRRFSIDESAKHQNGFTIYKITSVLFPLDSPEAVTVISVWKRYSDVQQLHKSMKSLHAGLHLRGTFPPLPKSSFFKRFNQEVINERAKTIQVLLEFVSEHRLLFTSTDFVNFLQTGYPEPDPKPGGVIDAIRSSLHLPIEETPPLEYQTSDDEARSPGARTPQSPRNADGPDVRTDADISRIPIREAADVEIGESPKTPEKPSDSDGFESLNSLESIDSDLFDELNRVTVDDTKSAVERNVPPDLIDFEAPSTSRAPSLSAARSGTGTEDGYVFEAGHLLNAAARCEERGERRAPSLSAARSGTGTEDGYVFEAGHLLNAAARCEERGERARAFECYKSGIEKMLVGVRTDPDPRRRALVKEKTAEYLSYAEAVYGGRAPPAPAPAPAPASPAPPPAPLRRAYRELGHYRVLGALAAAVMLVLDERDHCCYAMKVARKIPTNLTEFDDRSRRPADDARRPVLPTLVPYAVPLRAYVETDDLLFLVLAHAPGARLLEHVRRRRPRPAPRAPDLRNVFAEPVGARPPGPSVDRPPALPPADEPEPPGEALPPGAVRAWGAQLLAALESLHDAGVVCGDLSPRNVLLGERGQLILTYFLGYPGADVLAARVLRRAVDMHVAPELYAAGARAGPVCDFWSFGALMYELICGHPLALHHRTAFTRHTELRLPAGLAPDARSLLARLLTREPAERLGAGGADEIKRHPYFRGVDWRAVYDDWRPPR